MAPLSKSLPPSLKKIVVFLRRAEELDHDKSPESRVVAYNCRQYAVLTGIPLAGADPSAKASLGKLLDELEKEKNAMSTFSKPEHWAICRKVADKVFDKADGEDRSGLADKNTAKTFYAAGTFYEILQQFYDDKKDGNENTEQIAEEEQKRLYCKWKATDILNAIKEGREPTPGGYQQQQIESDEADMPDAMNLTTVVETPSVLTEAPSMSAELPPAPEMPTSNLFTADHETTNYMPDNMPPPSYENVELSINGSLVEDVQKEEETNEIFIPVAPSSRAELPPTIPPPCSDTIQMNDSSSIPSAESTISPPKSSTRLSSLFGRHKPNNKLTKNQMNDAVELTKFALAALQKGDGELGRQRLEEALGVLNN